MGNSLDSSVNIFDEWNGAVNEAFEMGDIAEDIEELMEPFQREEIVSNVASGLKSIIEAVSVGSLAAMQILHKSSHDDSFESDSEEIEMLAKKRDSL